MTRYYNTLELKAKTTRGLNKFWQGFALTDGIDFYTQSDAWQELESGGTSTVITSVPKRVKDKNVGKSNFIPAKEQAMLAIESALRNKLKKGYGHPDIESRNVILPMLAMPYKDNNHRIAWGNPEGVFVQPKFDGIRMTFDGKNGTTREGNPIRKESIAHIKCDLPNGCILDGELRLPVHIGTFEDTITANNGSRPDLTPHLQFITYDIAHKKGSFKKRFNLLTHLYEDSKWNLASNNAFKLAETIEVTEDSQIHVIHERFVAEGQEGIIIRNGNGRYKFEHRSPDLIKLKLLITDEFKIVNAKVGEGKNEEVVTFICETKEGLEFACQPLKGVCDTLEEAIKNIGNPLTIEFESLTKSGKPRYGGTGIAIRTYE